MKTHLMLSEPSWWVWLVTALLLATGLAGFESGFVAAIFLSAVQAGYFLWRQRSLKSYAVQIRVAYTLLLMVCFVPTMRWLYWLPTVGTFALLLFGYCLMARLLSLMPWNRSEAVTWDLFRRTFFTAPVLGNLAHGLPGSGCAGGVCELEARVGQRTVSSRPVS